MTWSLAPEQLRLYCAPCCRYLPAAELAARNASHLFVCTLAIGTSAASDWHGQNGAEERSGPGGLAQVPTTGSLCTLSTLKFGSIQTGFLHLLRVPLLRSIQQHTLHVDCLALTYLVQSPSCQLESNLSVSRLAARGLDWRPRCGLGNSKRRRGKRQTLKRWAVEAHKGLEHRGQKHVAVCRVESRLRRQP